MNVTIRLTVPEAVVRELRDHAAANGHELHDELAVMVAEHLRWRRARPVADPLAELRREVRAAAGRKRHRAEPRAQEVAELYRAGLTQMQIGIRLGLARSTVAGYIKRAMAQEGRAA